MAFVPIGSHFKKPQMQPISCTCRRFYLQLFISALLIGVLLMIHLMANIKEIFVHFHTESDTDGELVKLPMEFAEKNGALCLDGSPPAFYIRHGQEEGRNNWIVYLQGGAWCSTLEECYYRSKTPLGSTNSAPSDIHFDGLLSGDATLKQRFYTWNVAYLLYCDGGSFLGNRSDVLHYSSQALYFRGSRIFSAVIQYLEESSAFDSAEHVIMAGSSAGGIAALVNTDHLRKQLTKVSSIHAVVDGAFFTDTTSISGAHTMRDILSNTFNLHNMKNASAVQECVWKLTATDGWQCLLPPVFYQYVFTPVFFIQSLHDTWLMPNALGILDISSLGSAEKELLQKVKSSLLSLAQKIKMAPHDGVFLSPCPFHVTLINQEKFNRLKVNKTSLNIAFMQWYADLLPRNKVYVGDFPLSTALASGHC